MTKFRKGAQYLSPTGRRMVFDGPKPNGGFSFHFCHADGRGVYGRGDGNREELVLRDRVALALVRPAPQWEELNA